MKFYALIAAMLLSGGIAFAQPNPTVMIVNGQVVGKSEFEYFYHKNHLGNDKKNINEFTEAFVDYKLKVHAAKEAGLDSLPIIKRQLQSRLQCDKSMSPRLGSIRVAHILLRLGQRASSFAQNVAKQRIDSIYNALSKGADFDDLARKYSDDKASALQGGTLSWMGRGQTVKAFENTAFSLRVGEVSKPFLSEFGYHIVKLLDKNGTAESSTELHEKTDTLQDYQSQEFYEGLLVDEILNRVIWSKDVDAKSVANFYAKNKKKYKWEMKFLRKQHAPLPKEGEYLPSVLADYQDSLEKQWVSQLRKKYKVVVFPKMIATIKIR